jgi:hypothetical protein
MDGITMIARRCVLVAVCACIALAAVRAGAADASAKSFVEAIYAAYTGKNSNGVSLDSDAAVRRYFAPKLAALIIKDRREARGEVGKLGSDPFIDAQDWEIDSVDVAVRETGSDKASATVSFKSLASLGPLSSLWSSSRSDGASPRSRGIATELCAAF